MLFESCGTVFMFQDAPDTSSWQAQFSTQLLEEVAVGQGPDMLVIALQDKQRMTTGKFHTRQTDIRL